MGSIEKCRKSGAIKLHPLLSKPQLYSLDKALYTVQEAAGVLGVSTDSITRYCKKGTLFAQAVQYGRKQTFMIPRQAVQIFLQEQEQLKALAESNFNRRNVSDKAVNHADYLGRFKKALETGIMNGKVYSPRTIDDYNYYLNLYFSNHSNISADGLETELLKYDPRQKATKSHYYKAILCFSRYLAVKKAIDDSIVQSIRLLRPEENKNPMRHVVTLNEFIRIEQACTSLVENFLVRLLGSTGLRVSEACSLNWKHVDFERSELVNVEGKGGTIRDVAIPPAALDIIRKYYNHVDDNSLNAPILLNRNGKRMTPRGVHDRLERIGSRVGIKVHPHALRRAYVTINANNGVPLKALQESCGHKDLKTTSEYCRTSKQEALAIMKKVDW